MLGSPTPLRGRPAPGRAASQGVGRGRAVEDPEARCGARPGPGAGGRAARSREPSAVAGRSPPSSASPVRGRRPGPESVEENEVKPPVHRVRQRDLLRGNFLALPDAGQGSPGLPSGPAAGGLLSAGKHLAAGAGLGGRPGGGFFPSTSAPGQGEAVPRSDRRVCKVPGVLRWRPRRRAELDASPRSHLGLWKWPRPPAGGDPGRGGRRPSAGPGVSGSDPLRAPSRRNGLNAAHLGRFLFLAPSPARPSFKR